MEKKVEIIDITPTWEGVLDLYVEIAVNGNTAEARNAARSELRRMAQLADRYVQVQKEMAR